MWHRLAQTLLSVPSFASGCERARYAEWSGGRFGRPGAVAKWG
jgi:hypothetical protein